MQTAHTFGKDLDVIIHVNPRHNRRGWILISQQLSTPPPIDLSIALAFFAPYSYISGITGPGERLPTFLTSQGALIRADSNVLTVAVTEQKSNPVDQLTLLSTRERWSDWNQVHDGAWLFFLSFSRCGYLKMSRKTLTLPDSLIRLRQRMLSNARLSNRSIAFILRFRES